MYAYMFTTFVVEYMYGRHMAFAYAIIFYTNMFYLNSQLSVKVIFDLNFVHFTAS
jgi:hypothetical protein